MTARAILPLLILSLGLLVGSRAAAQSPITEKEKRCLEQCLKTFVYDPPPHAEWVRARVAGKWGEMEVEGWLVKAAGENRVYFADGRSIQAPKGKGSVRKLHFVNDFRARLKEDPYASKVDRQPFLVLAVWLYQRNLLDLAKRALKRAASGDSLPKVVAKVRWDLAADAYRSAYEDLAARSDKKALSHARRLFRLYPKVAESLPQARHLLSDLERRLKAKVGRPSNPPPRPKTKEKQVRHLIATLDEVAVPQWSMPRTVDLGNARRVRALIALGEVAVPALIDAIEKDNRLTRTTEHGHRWNRFHTILTVREAALTAVLGIVRVQYLHPQSSGLVAPRDAQSALRAADELRRYWKDNKHLTLPQRLMRTLKDGKSSVLQSREAVRLLGALADPEQGLSTPSPMRYWGGGSSQTSDRVDEVTRTEFDEPPGLQGRKAVLSLRDPTAAAAILKAMDRDVNRHKKGPAGLGFELQRFAQVPTVGKVLAGSRAEVAGVLVGDQLVMLGGRPLRNKFDVHHVLSSRTPGELVKLVLVRHGKRVEVTVSLQRALGKADPFDPNTPPRRDSLEQVEAVYYGALLELRDRRSSGELARRCALARTSGRTSAWRHLAYVCHVLGKPKPLDRFASAVMKGTLKLRAPGGEPRWPSSLSPRESQFLGVLRTLILSKTTSTEQALQSLLKPTHALHKETAALVLKQAEEIGFGREIDLTAHPVSLRFLARLLVRNEPDGWTYGWQGKDLTAEHVSGTSSSGGEELDRKACVDRFVGRHCDRAAMHLSRLLIGLPRYHPLLKDREARLRRIRTLCKRFLPRVRRATYRESVALNLSAWSGSFVPSIKPTRVATADDVKRGRAIFHLGGKGSAAKLKLPHVARVRKVKNEFVLVLQAEESDGVLHLGILGPGRLKVVRSSEVELLHSLPSDSELRAVAGEFLRRIRKRDEKQVRAMICPEAWTGIKKRWGTLGAYLDAWNNSLNRSPVKDRLDALSNRFYRNKRGQWEFQPLVRQSVPR